MKLLLPKDQPPKTGENIVYALLPREGIKNIPKGRVLQDDGLHINCLHLTNIYRNMRPLIEAGYVYVSCPPLYKVSRKVGRKEEVTYLYTPEELSAFDTEGCTIQRYKGLGEMLPEQLWETTMNPENCRLIQITMDDAELAEEIITACMDEDSSARREFVLYPERFAGEEDVA